MSDDVLIVIGDVLHEPWHSISVEGQMRTWLTSVPPHVRIRHSHARRLGSVGNWIDTTHEGLRWGSLGVWSRPGKRLIPAIDAVWGRPLRRWQPSVRVGTWAGSGQVSWQQQMPDLFALQRWKVLGSLEQSLREDGWNYIYFTTASSYIRVNALLKRVQDLPESGVFAGTVMTESTTGEPFASGANRIFSRDVVEMVVANRLHYTNSVMEDVGVSRLLAHLGIDVMPWPSLNVSSMDEIQSLTADDIAHHHHFRLRSEIGGKRQDVPLMHALHQRSTQLERT